VTKKRTKKRSTVFRKGFSYSVQRKILKATFTARDFTTRTRAPASGSA
jgi:hypothetical protein